MGLLQTANDLNEMIDGTKPFKLEDPRSVKQMLIDKGEWTEDDEQRLQDAQEVIADQEQRWGEERDYE